MGLEVTEEWPWRRRGRHSALSKTGPGLIMRIRRNRADAFRLFYEIRCVEHAIFRGQASRSGCIR